MLNYVKTSLKGLFINSRGMFVLLVLAQIFSVIIVVFSYGIVNHYNTKIDVAESTELMHDFNLKSQEKLGNAGIYMEISEIDNFLNRVLPIIENKLDYFFVMGNCGEYRLMSSCGYENRKYTLSTQIKKRVGISEGSIFTEDEVARGARCVLASPDMVENGEYVMLAGEKYMVKGVLATQGLNKAFYVPYSSIPEENNIYHISFIMNKPLLEPEFDEIVNAIRDCFGDKVNIPKFNGIMNESNNRVYRDIMMVSIILIFVFAIDYCIIYRYILEKRRKLFAVSRICGGSKKLISAVYMSELLGMSLITLVIGMFVFHNMMLPRATKVFEYINLYCNTELYITLGVIYMVILYGVYSVLISRFVRQTPVALIKEV